jgi:hypothetical protein
MPVTILNKLNAHVGFIGLGLMEAGSRGAYMQPTGISEHGTAVHCLQMS